MPQNEWKGIYQGSGRGYGFVTPEGGGEDYFIPPHRQGGAWDGDVVTVRLLPEESRDGHRKVGAVVSVLERANRTVVGVIRKQGREVWLIPDNRKLPEAIQVLGKAARAANGEKAAVGIISFGTRNERPMGRLAETFGRAGSRQAAVDATLYRYDIDQTFPYDVEKEAEAAPVEVSADALAARRDLRSELIITIDGAAAKDLDDAVSLTRDAQGRRVLGVHIADVSHYVAPDTALDREAWERGTSVYFADRVVPMLPPALSNGICSLHPKEDRLTLSCFMTMSEGGEVVEYEIVKSVICSAERMTYDDCNSLLDNADLELEQRYTRILPMLRDMADLASKLERRRRLRGSLDLESSEAVILCDAEGHPVEMELRKQGRAEKLIEEFMLCANETVARHLHQQHKPAVYRVHEKPAADKSERLRTMLAPFGLNVRETDHFSLQKVLDQVRDKPEAPIVNAILLRSLMKARYDAENLGHFGLAADYYCHFTSPIRRYPDLMVHRILTHLLAGTLHGPVEKKLTMAAQRAAEQSSRRELAAQSAEREIEKFYMAEFMLSHVGQVFTGAVSGVTRFGLFVMLPFGVEGMIPMEALPDDEYIHDEARMLLTGRRTGAVYSFGMPLEVVCVSADPGSGQIDFRLNGMPALRPVRSRTDQAPKPTRKKQKRGYRPPKRGKGRR